MEAAEALEHAHQFGVVHRDVKPANLLLDDHGMLFVTDFGLAHVGAGDGLTGTGDVVGTLRYMSPEQARGDRTTDPRSDVYSLGVTLYELLTLHSPFPGTDRQTLLRQVLDEDPVPARRANRAVPAELAVIVHKAMAKAPAERYPSAQALGDDLRAWLDDRPIRGRPPTLAQRAAKWARRHRAAVATAAVGLVLAAAGLLVSTLLIAAEGNRLQAAIGQLDTTLGHLRQSEAETKAALQAETALRDERERALEGERRAVYSYGKPLAQRALQDGDLIRAGKLLDEGAPELRGWEWHYLNRRFDTAALTLRMPFGTAANPPWTHVRYSADGQRIVSYTASSMLGPPYAQSWDARTGQNAGLFLAPPSTGSVLELSPDGSRCAVFTRAAPKAKADQPAVRVFDPKAARPVVRVFDYHSGTEVSRLTGPATGVIDVSFSPDGRHLAVAGADGTIVLADAATGEQLWAERASAEPVLHAAFSPDGATLATLASHKAFEPAPTFVNDQPPAELRFWDVRTGAARGQTAVQLDRPLSEYSRWLTFSPDGRHLSLTRGLTVGPHILTVPDARQVALPERAIVRMFSPDGRSVVYFLPDATAGVADLATGRQTVHFPLGEPLGRFGSTDIANLPRRAVAVSADGQRVAFAHGDGRVSVWDTASGRELHVVRGPTQVTGMDFSPDGQQVAAVCTDQTLKVWALPTVGDSRVIATAPDRTVFAALAVSPDGQTMAALADPAGRNPNDDRPSELVLWDLSTGHERLRRAVPGLKALWADLGIGGVQFSPDGQRVAVTGIIGNSHFFSDTGEDTLRRVLSVWDVARGVEVLTQQYEGPRESPVNCIAPPCVFGTRFDPAGRPFVYVVTRVSKGKQVLPTSAGKQPDQYALRTQDVDRAEPSWSLAVDCLLGPLAVSPDGRLAAVSAIRGKGPVPALQVWDQAANRCLWELPADPAGGYLLDVVFSPDGRRLLSVPLPEDRRPSGEAWRGEAIVWDAATGQAVCKFRPPVVNAPFGLRLRSRFVFSADGRRLASFGAVPGVRIWDAVHGLELLTLGGPDIVADATFGADGWLVTLGQDGTIRAWDGRTTPGLWRPPAPAVNLVQQARELANDAEAARRDPARAVGLAREAVQAYPNRGTFRAVLGLAQWRSGDVPAAVQDLEQSLALGAGANEGMCCFTLAMAHEKLGNPEAARAWFDRGERWLKALPNVTGADAIREQTRRFQSEAAARLGSGP